MNNTECTINFLDEELGDTMVVIKHNLSNKDFKKCFNTAADVLYFFEDYETFAELKDDYPNVTKEDYAIANDILEGGNCGVIAERFCEFLEKAFGFECVFIKPDLTFDVCLGQIEE